MASTCALSMATTKTPTSFFTLKPPANSSVKRLVVKSSMKDNAVLTAAVLTASMVVPEVAQAASALTPSLNNFLLSIGAGGVVLGGILGAIIGDPVKRG